MKLISIEDQNAVETAMEFLEKGEIVIFPSETCYGVAVDATNSSAVSKLLEYKKRPEGKAISIAVSSKEMAEEYVDLNQTAENLYNEFLPGAVTIVSKSNGKVNPRLESEKGTLGVRIPNYKFLLDLIERFGKPITATSANSSGKKTPYTIEDILDNISEKQQNLIGLIVSGGILPHNPPTTVIDTTTEDLVIHRQGRVDPRRIIHFDAKVTSSVEETILFGKEITERIKNEFKNEPIVILLNGELGVGKTQFTKGIAQGLGIERIIKSPTYNYVNEYKFDLGSDFNTSPTHILYHIDAWRIQSKNDLDLLQFERWFIPKNVIVIEWPSVIMNLDEDFFDHLNYFYIDFGILKEEKREIRVYFAENKS